jgi:hypothetical protein
MRKSGFSKSLITMTRHTKGDHRAVADRGLPPIVRLLDINGTGTVEAIGDVGECVSHPVLLLGLLIAKRLKHRRIKPL